VGAGFQLNRKVIGKHFFMDVVFFFQKTVPEWIRASMGAGLCILENLTHVDSNIINRQNNRFNGRNEPRNIKTNLFFDLLLPISYPIQRLKGG
jgi:hypothetical protein